MGEFVYVMCAQKVFAFHSPSGKLFRERDFAREVRREAFASGTLERVPSSDVQLGAGFAALATCEHFLVCRGCLTSKAVHLILARPTRETKRPSDKTLP